MEVVRVAYEALARAGLDRFMEHFTDDVEYRVLEGALDGDLAPLHGQDAVRAWLQDWIDMFDGFWQQLVELIDAGGDTVFTAERFGGRARLSGVEADSPNWTVFTIRDGKIASGHEYATRERPSKPPGCRSSCEDHAATWITGRASPSGLSVDRWKAGHYRVGASATARIAAGLPGGQSGSGSMVSS